MSALRPSTRSIAAAVLIAAVSAARADEPAVDVFTFFREESAAVTALRRPAATDRSPLAVDVITAEEIRASGATDVWDLLRFRVGVDVLDGRSQAGYDRAVVSVRGMPRDAVTELRVMVDGRSVNSPLDGGVIWNLIPVQLQDIERIEIVRGPNAALYGSNAGLGVIHIITRRPAKEFAASASAWGGNDGIRQGEAAVEAARADRGARLSASDRAQGGYPSANKVSPSNDWLHQQKANVRAWFTPEPSTTLELLAGLTRDGHGMNLDNDPQSLGFDHFQTLRLTQEFDGGSTLEARVSRTDEQLIGDPNTNLTRGETRYWKYDSEALHSIPWADGRLRTTYGLGWRYEASNASELYGPNAGVVTNRTVRGFFHQEIRVLDSLSVLGGVSNETANAGGWHDDFQAAVLWTPREDQSLRASFSRANTKPGLENRFAYQPFPLGGGFNGVLIGSRELKPSPLTDYEAGWTGRFLDRTVECGLTGYYMYVVGHLNIDSVTPPAPFVFAMMEDNTNVLQLRGLEASVKWRVAPGRSVYANFTREIVTDEDAHSLYVNTTPKHKVNFGADSVLPWGLRVSFNAAWKDAYLADSNTGTTVDVIPAYWRLDARLGWTPRPWLELFAAGRNLIAPQRREYLDGLAAPRIFFAGATARY